MSAPKSVLVIGESILDIVTDAAGSREFPGGGPANVALALARLGVQAELLTSVGADAAGEFILDHLRSNGVTIAPTSTGPHPTSRAIATLDAQGVASYVFEIVWDIPAAAPTSWPAAVHTGSIGAFLSPGADAVFDIIAARPADTLFTFDPNIRAAIIGDRDAALDRFTRFCRLADVVKLSDEDAAWLYPGASADDVLNEVLELGVKLAVITLGAEGAELATSTRLLRVAARKVTLVDTIGAGDTFMANLIAGVLELPAPADLGNLDQDDLAILGRDSVAGAAIAVSRAGANPPTRAERDLLIA
jgi:fructokinase